jgi:hypothetical protein
MSASAIGAVVFACVFGGALLGTFLGNALPKHHLDTNSRDVIKVATATIATLTALVIGLLIASAKTSFDNKDGTIRRAAAHAILLDHTLAEYGSEAREARDLLRQNVATTIRQIWPMERMGKVEPEAISRGHGIEAIQQNLLALSPKNDQQRWLKSTALQISQDMATARWRVFEQLDSGIQWPFLTILVFWLVTIFTSFGLFAPRNSTVITALLVASLSVAGAIFLILEMDQPYGGLISISSAPLSSAMELLGR